MFRWVRKFDADMRRKRRKVALTLDNFSGHYIDYEPRNVELVYLEPNLTSHVQPLDGGIIRCVKAHYRRNLSIRALDLDEAGEDDIFKIDLLSTMKLLRESWDEVTPETIQNCWKHVGITPRDDEEWEDVFINADAPGSDSDVEMVDPSESDSSILRKAWEVVLPFAESEWTLPQAEEQLELLLGDGYDRKDWEQGLDAVMKAEGDSEMAVKAVKAIIPRFTLMEPQKNPPPLS